MDGYIRGLKHEAEQMLSDVDEAKERGRRELDDTDHQIFELMRQKDEQKAKVDKKVKTLKNQADAKMAMYHRAAGVRCISYRVFKPSTNMCRPHPVTVGLGKSPR